MYIYIIAVVSSNIKYSTKSFAIEDDSIDQ